ncbi:MAG: class I SAM-dependent methyltransferase [Alkalilacustris sp.]
MYDYLSADPFGENPLPHLKDAEWCFVQCNACGQKFHQRILNPEWNKIYYNRWITAEAIESHARSLGNFGFRASFNKGVHSVERILQIEWLTEELRGADPVRLLDFGCGDGRFLAACAAFGFECVGVEFSSAREKTRVADFFGGLEEVRAEMAPGHFHAVVLFEVLEHLAEPLQTLKALHALLARGGVLVLETPNCPNVTSINSISDYRLIDPLGHINAFTPETQERIANEAGFARVTPGTPQCTVDPMKVYKRELKRLLRPLLKRYTQQYFVAT